MNIFKLLTYDIKEHNYILYTSFQPNSCPNNFWRTILRAVKSTIGRRKIWYIIKQLWNPFYKTIKPLNKVVFAPISDNNRRSLEPIWSNLDKKDYSVVWSGDGNYMPDKLVRFWSLVFIWPLIKLYINSSKSEKLLIRTYFDEFFSTIGIIVVLDKLLKHNNVKLIVMSNDHCPYPRALVTVAKEYGIKTMYTQHCSVTERFPYLPFDYSFLDGMESYLKYRGVGVPLGKVYLSGNPRFDIISKYKDTDINNNQKIGIAISNLDDIDIIKDLFLKLLSRGYNQLVVRPHPNTSFDPTWYLNHGIEYSDSNSENPFEFIARMKVIIAGECGIHLDAAMMGVQSICYNTRNALPLDWYSYIKNGLTPYADNIDRLFVLLDNNANENLLFHEKAKWYNAMYGTKYEGMVGEILAEFIQYELIDNVDAFDEKYGFVDVCCNEYYIKSLCE